MVHLVAGAFLILLGVIVGYWLGLRARPPAAPPLPYFPHLGAEDEAIEDQADALKPVDRSDLPARW